VSQSVVCRWLVDTGDALWGHDCCTNKGTEMLSVSHWSWSICSYLGELRRVCLCIEQLTTSDKISSLPGVSCVPRMDGSDFLNLAIFSSKFKFCQIFPLKSSPIYYLTSSYVILCWKQFLKIHNEASNITWKVMEFDLDTDQGALKSSKKVLEFRLVSHRISVLRDSLLTEKINCVQSIYLSSV